MALAVGNYLIAQLPGGGTTSNLDTTAAKALVVFLAPDVGFVPVNGISFADFNGSFLGNSYSTIPNFPTPGISTGIRLFGFYVLNPIVATDTRWFLTGSASLLALCLTDSVTPDIDTAASDDYFDTTADPGSISVVTDSIVLAAISSNRTSGFFTVPSGYALIDNVDSDGNDRYLSVAYKTSPSATEQPTWAGAGFQGGVGVASFKPGGGGGGGGKPFPYYDQMRRMSS